jgi:pimeloyl-ACP methyl ester carboxylesterase
MLTAQGERGLALVFGRSQKGSSMHWVVGVAALVRPAPRAPRASDTTAPRTRTRASSPLAVMAPTQSLRFTYNGFECSCVHKPASPGYESEAPLLLVHPVGIGLSSWFYEELIEAWKGGALYAPDLIGCGESAEWDPSVKGLFIPLDWTRQLEELWRCEIKRPCVVVGQGGLAPIAVSLAARATDNWDGARAVERIVLASPPTWEEISEGSDSGEVARNFKKFSSPLGTLAYKLLRTRLFVEFFSNLFLFADRADERWLRRCEEGATPLAARWPVFAFNSGLVGLAPLGHELRALSQPLLVLSGNGDKRAAARLAYGRQVPDCVLRSIRGCNVLPYESPRETCDAIHAFCRAGVGSDTLP